MDIGDEALCASNAQLRIHGNGFLQAETVSGNKLHIWHKDLPRQKVPTFNHNHNHGFTSTVVRGTLMWYEYHIEPAGNNIEDAFTPHVCVVRKGKDTELVPSGGPVRIVNERFFYLQQGSQYDWPLDMDLYHRVFPGSSDGFAVSYVVRGEYNEDVLPTVLVPIYERPDNSFDRYAHDEVCKRVYDQVIDQLLREGAELEAY